MKAYYRTGLQWHRLLFLMAKMLVVLFWNVKAINLTLRCDGCWEFASSNGPGSWVSRTGYLKLCYSIRKTNIFLFCFYSEQIYAAKWLKHIVYWKTTADFLLREALKWLEVRVVCGGGGWHPRGAGRDSAWQCAAQGGGAGVLRGM